MEAVFESSLHVYTMRVCWQTYHPGYQYIMPPIHTNNTQTATLHVTSLLELSKETTHLATIGLYHHLRVVTDFMHIDFQKKKAVS